MGHLRLPVAPRQACPRRAAHLPTHRSAHLVYHRQSHLWHRSACSSSGTAGIVTFAAILFFAYRASSADRAMRTARPRLRRRADIGRRGPAVARRHPRQEGRTLRPLRTGPGHLLHLSRPTRFPARASALSSPNLARSSGLGGGDRPSRARTTASPPATAARSGPVHAFAPFDRAKIERCLTIQ